MLHIIAQSALFAHSPKAGSTFSDHGRPLWSLGAVKRLLNEKVVHNEHRLLLINLGGQRSSSLCSFVRQYEGSVPTHLTVTCLTLRMETTIYVTIVAQECLVFKKTYYKSFHAKRSPSIF